MKKRLFAILAICVAFVLMMTGCQAALISSNVLVNADGSGTKTITAVIYGDDSILAGEENAAEPGTVGNNSKYLLVSGDDLIAKIKSYSALDSLEVTAVPDGLNTIVTVSYSFDSIEDYTAKTKTLAKDNADSIEAPTFTQNADGSYTYKENTENTQLSLDNIFLSLYNDPEAFSKDGQGDCDLESFGYDYTCIYTIMDVSATVGTDTNSVQVNVYNDSNTIVEQDWADYIEVTGTPVVEEPEPEPAVTEPAPAVTEPEPAKTEPEPAKAEPAPAAEKTGLSTGALLGIICGCAVVVAAVVIVCVVLSKKKKAAKE